MTTFNILQEGPVNGLALNRETNQVAIAGRNIFKIYQIEDDRFREISNFRASKNLSSSFTCNDVTWSVVDDYYLATASTNGHVCLWNLTRTGRAMLEQDYQEHKRTVNKVNFHPSESNKLISGSQDGSMRYFDTRLKTAVAIFQSNTESVRDVQFSPHFPCSFASVSENGSVQLWDIRRPDKCAQQYTAHSGPIFACDWHPENAWLATASRDRTIKVWDLTSKPTLEYTIHNLSSIGHVRWRPQRKYHLASCALVVDCSINVWDVRRPYIPFATFNDHKDIPSGIVWRGDPHMFLSIGRDCILYHHSFTDAERPASKANPHGISWNIKGEVLFSKHITASNTTLVKSTMGLMRKTSTSTPPDQFHQACSLLQQFTISTPLHGCEDDSFLNLAKSYILSGKSVSEMCEYNAAVAKENGKSHISVFWKIIKTIYGEEYTQNSISSVSINRDDNISLGNLVSSVIGMEHVADNDARSRGGDTPGAQFSGGDDETENEDQVDHIALYNNGFPTYLNLKSGLPKGDFSFGENELDMEMDGFGNDFRTGYRGYPQLSSMQSEWILPSEAFPLRHEIRDGSPPPGQFSNHNLSDMSQDSRPRLTSIEDYPTRLLTIKSPLNIPIWDPGNIVIEALKHHAILGDVQTAATVLMVLGEQRRSLKLDETTQELWLLGYIELLNRYKLWNIATQIIKLSWLPSISQLNQQSTRINTNCSKCSKPLQRIGWLCDRCHSSEYALCSVCHQVVKGLYTWCQGCSHGGHLVHIEQWLRENKTCPTGCGHFCEYR